MKNAPNIVLVGPMGAGKTTIGRLLSQTLEREFFDSDRVIEEKAGADIPWIFDKEGEDGFRRRETHVLQEMLEEPEQRVVLATGGGIVMREENRALLRKETMVVYLYASVEQQLHRTSKSNHRPLLKKGNPKETLTNLFKIRDPLYRDVASLIVETDARHPRAVANKVLDAIKNQFENSESPV
ncbi:shikimate kinase AroK [Marinomonas mediterranea]|jgi:shikimate kinase (EC 2.7.1.71)|uniref:Shikimate kinase n=1 Tax=Marinomonas mediterranea (strain ATCC 700492 / JCM 21426 / NBRC 103028 / MMB-1) TaxID=717774 RepID=F2JW41_MARM1|nr:shikimate kinase AroK [Marinomonas mediterranea]ADZ92929.1 Shikimate kinase [Marinomonas mediterranea MMB-1]WCN10851.1 shikimate kinase AroK [Marinomonas mediterranea]WCN14908.1 shikimate kinase AroK [Marinomonas mediterranea]WCN18952.1 shikimate kinase AroK [Marinomonas mediterranea MMB-1]